MPKIHTTQPNNAQTRPSSTNEVDNSVERVIELEKLISFTESEIRKEIFNQIVTNTRVEEQPLEYVLYGAGGILFSCLLTCFYTMIPVHNVILNQEYWYEFPLQIILSFLPMAAANVTMQCSYYMNVKIIKTFRHILVVWLVTVILASMYFVFGYIIWSKILHFHYPIPMNGYLVSFVVFPSLLVTLWYQFPWDWRKNESFRKRLKFFFLAMIFSQTLTFEYAFLTKLLQTVSTDYQWIVAIFLPLIREFNIWAITKLARKSASGDISSMEIVANYAMGTRHALFLTVTVGSIGTIATTSVMMGCDFLINIYTALKILFVRQKNPDDKTEQAKLLQTLVINEMVEVMVPITYLLCFLLAYFGPNAELIGDIGNSYWQFSAVEDVGGTILIVSIFFFVDLLSLVFSTFLLKRFCQISVYQAYIALQKEFSLMFNVVLAARRNPVSK